MKKFIGKAIFVVAVYTIGFAFWIVFSIFKLIGKVRIVNPDNLPRLKPGTIIISNHPDLMDCMYEIFLIPALFYSQFFFHPLKCSPYFTLDKKNFKDKWYWNWWLGDRAIAIQRGAGNGRVAEAKEIVDVLGVHKGIIVHFGEGGRTCTGNKFQLSPSGKRKIRPLKPSVGWLVLKTQACVITIWLENGPMIHQPGKRLFSLPKLRRGEIVVKIGKTMEANKKLMAMSPSELTEIISANLLELADQE